MAWYESMTPVQARAFLNHPVETKVVGRDHYTGRDIIAPVYLPALKDIEAIAKIAEQA